MESDNLDKDWGLHGAKWEISMCTTLYLWWARWVVLEMLILGKAEIEIAYVSLTEEGVLGEASEVVRLRRDKRCWLRRLNLRKDSRLRLARLRREAALLKPPPSSPPPPADLLSTLLETKLRVPWRERRTFPIQPDTCEWATDNLSPRYSISQDLEWVNSIKVCVLNVKLFQSSFFNLGHCGHQIKTLKWKL